MDVYDQNIPTVAFWSLATSPSHVGIQRGKLMWHKIQPGPIRCSHLYFFPYEFFVSFMDQAQHCILFIFGPWPFSLLIFYFQPFYFAASPSSQNGPTCHAHLKIGPTCQKCTNLTNYFHKWPHWTSFHSTSFQITYIINISNRTKNA